MTSYVVDSRAQGMKSTGIVTEALAWEERDGKRRPSDLQARDADTGMPLWAVEVIYRQTSWGRVANVTNQVVVGAPQQPVLGEFVPVAFVGLRVEVRLSKAGGLTESWSAEALADAQPSASGSGSGSGKAA